MDKMSEKKYYVRLKLDGQLLMSGGFYDEEFGCDEYNEFTKKELAEIMDGALYTQTLSKDCMTPDHVYYGSGEEIVSEWINPLIELVPVEEG